MPQAQAQRPSFLRPASSLSPSLVPKPRAARGPHEFYRKASRGSERFAVLYADGESVRTETFAFAADGWQERRASRLWPKAAPARAWLRRQGYSSSSAAELRSGLEEKGSTVARSGTVLWPVENQWSVEWEKRFSAWVNTEVDESFFVRFALPTDCADVAYTLRWIFARNNKLPAANRLAATGRLFTNFDVRSAWESLPTDPDWSRDRRFRAALAYVMTNTYTHTLFDDSYPVRLDLDAFSPGGFHLGLHGSSGHTQVIYRGPSETSGLPFMMLSSTVPQDVRKLFVHFYWGSQPVDQQHEGFKRIRWAQGSRPGGLTLLAGSQHPWHSLEQYTMPDDGRLFAIRLIEKLDPGFQIERVVGKILSDLEEQVRDRMRVVDEGYAFCQQSDCSPDSAAYENWSTPSRDARLGQQFRDARIILGLCETCYQMIEDFRGKQVDLNGERVALGFLLYTVASGHASSDPRVGPAARWGVDLQQMSVSTRDKLAPLLRSRETLVDARSDSQQLDAEIAAAVGQLDSFSRYLTPDRREELSRAARTQTLDFGGSSSNLEDLRRDHIFWSARAGDLPAQRWSDASSSSLRALPPYAGETRILPGALAWMAGGQELLDLRSGLPMAPPAGYEWHDISPRGDQALLKRDGALSIFERSTGQVIPLDGLQQAEVSYFFFEKDYVLVWVNAAQLRFDAYATRGADAGRRIASLELMDESSVMVTYGDPRSDHSWFARGVDGVWNLFDGRAWRALEADLAGLAPVAESKQAVIFQSQTEPNSWLSFEKDSGALRPFPFEGTTLMSSDLSLFATNDGANNSEVLSLDPSLSEILRRKATPGWGYFDLNIAHNLLVRDETGRLGLADFQSASSQLHHVWPGVVSHERPDRGLVLLNLEPFADGSQSFELWDYGGLGAAHRLKAIRSARYLVSLRQFGLGESRWAMSYDTSGQSSSWDLACLGEAAVGASLNGIQLYPQAAGDDDLASHPLIHAGQAGTYISSIGDGAIVFKGLRPVWLDKALCR